MVHIQDDDLVVWRTAGYRVASTINAFFTDAGIACAWSPSGSCVAAASQDGQVRVWEPRSGKVRTAALGSPIQGMHPVPCLKGREAAPLLACRMVSISR